MRAATVRRIRERLRLTQAQLADKIGVHRVTVAKWESGALPIPKAVAMLLRLAEERGAIPKER